MKIDLGLQRGIRNLILKLSGLLLIKTANTYNRLFGYTPQFRFDSEQDVYSYSDKNTSDKLFFKHKKRIWTYNQGLNKRINALGKAYLLHLIDFKDGDKVIDCGANIGELYYWFKINNLKINYIGFEPSPEEFTMLQKNVPSGTLYNIGLWFEVDELEFYLDSDNADSSFLEIDGRKESIKIQADILSNYINDKIKLLKLEAEGAEPEILRGAEKSLGLIEYIAADLGPERGFNQEYTLIPVINFLLERGFEIVEMNYPRCTVLFKNKRFK